MHRPIRHPDLNAYDEADTHDNIMTTRVRTEVAYRQGRRNTAAPDGQSLAVVEAMDHGLSDDDDEHACRYRGVDVDVRRSGQSTVRR